MDLSCPCLEPIDLNSPGAYDRVSAGPYETSEFKMTELLMEHSVSTMNRVLPTKSIRPREQSTSCARTGGHRLDRNDSHEADSANALIHPGVLLVP